MASEVLRDCKVVKSEGSSAIAELGEKPVDRDLSCLWSSNHSPETKECKKRERSYQMSMTLTRCQTGGSMKSTAVSPFELMEM